MSGIAPLHLILEEVAEGAMYDIHRITGQTVSIVLRVPDEVFCELYRHYHGGHTPYDYITAFSPPSKLYSIARARSIL